MLKKISNLGTALKAKEQQTIKGGGKVRLCFQQCRPNQCCGPNSRCHPIGDPRCVAIIDHD